MADIKISALPGASTLTGAETIPLVQGGTTKKVTTDQFLIKDASGNVGLGVTPSAWGGGRIGFDVGKVTALFNDTNGTADLALNAYWNGTQYVYKITAAAARYEAGLGMHKWYTAPSGTAGNAISFTQAMTLDSSGRLQLGAGRR